MPVLWRASLRYVARHRWQFALSVVGVALGVAMLLAIDLANASSRRAFELFTDTVAGRATHRIVGTSRGVPEALYATLKLRGPIDTLAPVVEADVTLPAYPGRVLHVLGVDSFAEGPFRPFTSQGRLIFAAGESDLSALWAEPATALLAAPTAAELGLAAGGTLTLNVAGRRRAVRLVALLEPDDRLSRQALANLLICDIATAQELLGMLGRLSRIDVLAPPGQAGERALAALADALPPEVALERSEQRSEAVEQLTAAFHLNLSALSLLALVVGMFLIYNTVTFSVVQRRALLGTLRAVGVTRREIFAAVLLEAALVGVLGTLLGLALGTLLARGVVGLVTRTINDLYFVLSVRSVALPAAAFAKASLLGVGATLLAAAAPALEATGAPPRAAFLRSLAETRLHAAQPRAVALGLGLLAVGGVLLALPRAPLWGSFAGLFGVILGFALLTPLATLALIALVRPPAERLLGALGRLATRGVTAALSRTAVAIAALSLAVSVSIGVGVMVSSFRDTVVVWLERTLQADVYVRPPVLVSSRAEASLAPRLVERLAATAGVAGVASVRVVEVPSPSGPTQVLATRTDRAMFEGHRFKARADGDLWARFRGGAVAVSEPFSHRRGVGVGGIVTLLTDRGPRTFPVIGVYYDYGSVAGTVMMERGVYNHWFDDRAVTGLALDAAPGVGVDELVSRLRSRADAGQAVDVLPTRQLREASLAVFDRTFRITQVLRVLALVVALIGVLSALMAIALERARELAVLRALGLTPQQLFGLVLTQTGVMGLIAGILAVPAGVVLALILILVINKRSFGWTLQVSIPPELLITAVGWAVLAALLAGLYPAWRMARTAPALALREE